MAVYLISFIFPPLLMRKAYKQYVNNKKYLFLIAISIFILAMIAGLRGLEIGTDIRAYQKNMFIHATRSSSFSQFCREVSESSNEYGYLLTLYVSNKLFKNINIFFFIEELLVIIPVYYAIWYYKKIVNPGFVTMAYCLLFYTETFNVIRQNIAMSFVFCSILLFLDRRYIKSIVLWLIAFSFHKTTLLSLIFFPLYYYLCKAKNKLLFIYVIGAVTLFITLLYQKLITVLTTIIPIFPARYLSSRYIYSGFNLPIVSLFECFICLIIMLIAKKYIKSVNVKKEANARDSIVVVKELSQVLSKEAHFINNYDLFNFVLLMNMVSCASFYLQGMSNVAARLIWYFQIFNVFSIGLLFKILKKSEYKLIFLIGTFLFLLVCWYYNYAYIGNASVYPYKFFWQL